MKTVINIILTWFEDCSDESSGFERSHLDEIVLVAGFVDG